MKSLVLYFLIILGPKLFSQQLSISYFSNNNPELFNAAAWNTDVLKYSFIPKNEFFTYYRSQWTGIDLGPKYLGCHYNYLSKDNIIIGLGIIHESFGPYSSSNVSGQYAYRIQLKNNSFISGGGSIGFNFYGYDPSSIAPRELPDPIAETKENTFGLTFSPGLFYTKSLKNDLTINFGLSYQNAISFLFTSKNDLKSLASFVFHCSLFKFMNSGYSYLSYYEISFIHRRFKSISDDTDISFKYQWNGYISFKPGLRFGTIDGFNLHSLHLDFGIPLSNSFKNSKYGIDLNYSCEIPLVKFGGELGLSHELSFGILF